MKYIELSTEEIRNIITGKTTYRKCPLCDDTGTEFLRYDAEGFAVAPDFQGEFFRDECANCGGVAFIKNAQ